MFPEKILFRVDECKNNSIKSGCNYVLKLRIDERGFWSIYDWDKKPSDDEINALINAVISSMELYHRHLKVPSFMIKVEKDERIL